MNSVLGSLPNFNAASFWTVAILAVLGGVVMLLVFQVGRRAFRQFAFAGTTSWHSKFTINGAIL
jgi:hypothetical protein